LLRIRDVGRQGLGKVGHSVNHVGFGSCFSGLRYRKERTKVCTSALPPAAQRQATTNCDDDPHNKRQATTYTIHLTTTAKSWIKSGKTNNVFQIMTLPTKRRNYDPNRIIPFLTRQNAVLGAGAGPSQQPPGNDETRMTNVGSGSNKHPQGTHALDRASN
jgi:hypothetical protein